MICTCEWKVVKISRAATYHPLMRYLVLLTLTACADAPTVSPRAQVAYEVPVEMPESAPAPTKQRVDLRGTTTTDCTGLRARREELGASLKAENARMKAWQEEHCKRMMHRQTNIDPGTGARASSAYDAGWLECDGQIVNTTESRKQIVLRSDIGKINDQMVRCE